MELLAARRSRATKEAVGRYDPDVVKVEDLVKRQYPLVFRLLTCSFRKGDINPKCCQKDYLDENSEARPSASATGVRHFATDHAVPAARRAVRCERCVDARGLGRDCIRYLGLGSDQSPIGKSRNSLRAEISPWIGIRPFLEISGIALLGRTREPGGSTMSPPQVTPESPNPSGVVGLVVKPRVIAAADANEVMREQLDFLIEHSQGGPCGCLQCERYVRARTLLLEAFRTGP